MVVNFPSTRFPAFLFVRHKPLPRFELSAVDFMSLKSYAQYATILISTIKLSLKKKNRRVDCVCQDVFISKEKINILPDLT